MTYIHMPSKEKLKLSSWASINSERKKQNKKLLCVGERVIAKWIINASKYSKRTIPKRAMTFHGINVECVTFRLISWRCEIDIWLGKWPCFIFIRLSRLINSDRHSTPSQVWGSSLFKHFSADFYWILTIFGYFMIMVKGNISINRISSDYRIKYRGNVIKAKEGTKEIFRSIIILHFQCRISYVTFSSILAFCLKGLLFSYPIEPCHYNNKTANVAKKLYRKKIICHNLMLINTEARQLKWASFL